MLFIIAAILAGLLVAQPAIAESPTIESSVINPPYGPERPSNLSATTTPIRLTQPSGRHSTRAEKQISVEQLQVWLSDKESPLAPYASQILSSPYYSTIIGICWIEELKCTINPHGSNNFWGLMSGGKIIRYPTMEAGIEAINAFLIKAEGNGKTTIESMRGWYCASACTNWEPTVIRIKNEVESL